MAARIWSVALLLSFSVTSLAQTSKDTKPARHKAPKVSADYVIEPKSEVPPPWADKSQGSEKQHQAPNEVFEFTATAVYRTEKTNYAANANPTSLQASGYQIELTGEYGFNELLSAGIRLQYLDASIRFSPDNSRPNGRASGLYDPQLFLKVRADFESSSLRYGSDLGISPGDWKLDNSDSNAYSGGIWLRPFIGYEYYYGSQIFGARLEYRYFVNDRKIVASGTSGTVSGGNIFLPTLFYEYDMRPMKLGLAFEAEYTSKYNVTSPGTGEFIASSSQYGLQVYAPIEITESFTLVPKAAYQWYGTTSGFDSRNGWQVIADGRFAF